MLKKILLISYLLLICPLFGESLPESKPDLTSISPTKDPLIWEGLFLKGYFGTAIEYLKPPKQASPMAGFSLEYSWLLDQKVFLSVEGTWLYYPQMFNAKEFTVAPIFGDWTIPSWAFYFIPITGVHIGYVTDSNDLFTIGLAYFWGLTGSYRHPIDENLSFETRATWFYDRFLYNDGLHDLHVVVGINYRF